MRHTFNYTGGNFVLESVKFKGSYIGVTKEGVVNVVHNMGSEAQFFVKCSTEQSSYHRAGTSVLEVGFGYMHW